MAGQAVTQLYHSLSEPLLEGMLSLRLLRPSPSLMHSPSFPSPLLSYRLPCLAFHGGHTSLLHYRLLATRPKLPIPTILRENIYTLPNALTVSRILSCPVLGWSILNGKYHMATGLLAYAGLSDWVCNSYIRSRLSPLLTRCW